jgi:hypothetical protein
MIGRILLTLTGLAVSGLLLLVLIGLWDRYEEETAALGFGGIYERYLASQAGFSVDLKGRAAPEAERRRQRAASRETATREQVAPMQTFQQWPKLVGTGAVGSTNQGMSVALSADGNTAIVGGPGDNPWDRSVPFGLGAAGAAWVFTRSGGVWTQQGNKLIGTGAVARQGTSVALSTDGNVAIVGGLAEDGGVALVFTRSGGHWTQDKKLVGPGAVGKSTPSVALSADGNIVMVGGSNDNGGVGAAWVFTRGGDYRTHDKNLVGTAPSASADGSMVGRSNDKGGVGVATVLTRSGGGSDSQEPPRPPAPSNPALNLEE